MTESPLKNLDTALASILNHEPKPCLHLTNKAILVHGSSLLSSTRSRGLSPHLLYILQHHIAMPVECLHASEQLSVVSARNQDLGVGSDGGLEDRERAGGKFMLFELGDFVFSVLEVSINFVVARLKNVRELVSWLCQQFSVMTLASN